jgi:ribosomal protein S21
MKNNNWQKNAKEQYNTRAPKTEYTSNIPTKILSGTTIAVWNDDVGGALRKLKKVLERDNRQKDIARHEYFEKPSAKRKRNKDAAKSRWKKEVSKMRGSHIWVDAPTPNLKWMKTKKKRRVKSELQKTLKNLRD